METPSTHTVTMQALTVALVLLGVSTVVLGQGTEHPLVPCAQEVSDKCPAIDGATPTYLADPEDCSKFCVCNGGTAFEEKCLPGLVWDPSLHVCNWPTMVDCGDRPM